MTDDNVDIEIYVANFIERRHEYAEMLSEEYGVNVKKVVLGLDPFYVLAIVPWNMVPSCVQPFPPYPALPQGFLVDLYRHIKLRDKRKETKREKKRIERQKKTRRKK
jgi:hypothetical protein